MANRIRSVGLSVVNVLASRSAGVAIVSVVIVLLLIGVAMWAAGCQSSSTVTPGTTSLRSVERVIIDPATGAVTGRERESVGTATGAGATASGEKISQDVSGSAPRVTLPGGGSSSGGSFDSETDATSSSGRWVVLVLGVLCLLAGGAGIYLGIRALAVVGGVAGALLITAGLYPALLLWLVLGAVVVVGLYAVWAGYAGARAQSALAAIVRAIEKSDPSTAIAAKAAIGAHIKPADKATITATKVREGV